MSRTKIIASVVLVLAILLIFIMRGCGEQDRTDQAVTIDRAEVSRDAYEKGLAAERSATTNQIAEAATFRNEQDKADDKIDDAARRRVSPLDDLFSGMR